MTNVNDGSLNISALKNTLLEDDFGLEFESGRPNEIDSMDSLNQLPNPDKKDDKADKDKDQDIVNEVEEIEGDVPEPTVASTPASNQPTTPQGNNKQEALLEVFASNLAEAGLIDFKKEEFDKAEDKDTYFRTKYEESLNKEVDSRIKAKESEWPEEIEKLVELHKKGVPLHKILESDARISTLEDIKPADIESDPNLQKDILRELLSVQGFSKDKIDLKIKRYEDLGSLKDEASEGFDTLLSLEKTEKERVIRVEAENKAKADQARLDRLKEIEDSINTSEEIISGFKLSPEDKKILINGITKTSGTDKQGRPINALTKARLEDPKMDLKVAYFTLVLKGDLSKLQAKAATKTARSLKDVVDSTEPITGSSQSAGNTTNTNNKVNKEVMKNSLKFLKRSSY